jgi:hypothetical protein
LSCQREAIWEQGFHVWVNDPRLLVVDASLSYEEHPPYPDNPPAGKIAETFPGAVSLYSAGTYHGARVVVRLAHPSDRPGDTAGRVSVISYLFFDTDTEGEEQSLDGIPPGNYWLEVTVSGQDELVEFMERTGDTPDGETEKWVLTFFADAPEGAD